MSTVATLDRESRDEQIRAATQAGESASIIAARHGISTRTVSRIRTRLGIAQTVPPPLTAAQHQRVQQLIEDGCSAREIARTIGCADATIRKHYPHAVWTRAEAMDFAHSCRRMAS